MRILVDGIAFQNDYQRGVQRYFRELLGRVARNAAVDLFLSSDARGELPPGCRITFRREWFMADPKNLPLRLWRKFRRNFAPTRFSGHSVFHSSFFTPCPEAGVAEVVTVHDMVAEDFREMFRHTREPHIAEKRRCMESARKIICISHATAADVARIYPQFKEKLVVVHHGADHLLPAHGEQPPATKPCEEKYLLFVGDRDGYKNFQAVMLAMGESAWPAQVSLIAVGGQTRSDETDLVRHYGLHDRIRFRGFVSDAELADLYRGTAGFIFPSLGEGFGFPLLEAQSLKVPVLCSDIPVFHEVGGDSPIFFDPRDPAAIARAVAQRLETDVGPLAESGYQNVRRFRWDECAERTGEVYHEVSAKS